MSWSFIYYLTEDLIIRNFDWLALVHHIENFNKISKCRHRKWVGNNSSSVLHICNLRTASPSLTPPPTNTHTPCHPKTIEYLNADTEVGVTSLASVLLTCKLKTGFIVYPKLIRADSVKSPCIVTPTL